VGDPAFDLVITGTNFVPASQVLFNGTALSPTVGSSTVMTVTVPADRLTAAGLLPVVVRNPVGIDSGPATFILRNPQPAVTSLSPGSAQALGPAFALQVNGSGFVSGAQVLWDGEALPTTFNSSGRLTAQVSAGRILSGGAAQVSVLNPGPEAQASPAVPFFINATFNEFLPFMSGAAAPQ
jgi:hypothetical protein